MKNKTTLFLIAVFAALMLLLLAWPTHGQTSQTLPQLAASMEPGTFALLHQDGDGSGYGNVLLCMEPGTSNPDGIGCSLAFSRKAAYDPVTDRILHIGAPHSGTTHYIQLDAAANKWTTLSGNPHTGHTQGSVTIYPQRREFFAYAGGDGGKLQNLDTGAWRTISSPPGSASFGSWEYFPERDELLHVGEKTLSKWDRATDTWTVIADNSVLGGMQSHFNEARYNPVHEAVLLVGGYDYSGFGAPDSFSHALYKYDKNGTITRLKDSPRPINTGSNTGHVIADPASGEFLFLNAVLTETGGYAGSFTFYSYNWVSETWTDLTSRFPKGFSAAEGNPFATIPVAISKYGVTAWMSAVNVAGSSKVYLYKHATSTEPPIPPDPPPAGSDFVTRCAQPGVLACWGFDSDSDLKYAWDQTMPELSAAMAGKEWHSVSNDRGSTEGNTVPIQHVSGALSIPVIDKTVFASGTGSLRINVPSQSEPNSGWFQDNINKVLGNPSAYIAPGSPLGSVLYFQFKFRPSDTLMSTVYREPEATISYTLNTTGAGSRIIQNSYDVFTPVMVGRPIAIQGPYNASPWAKGMYQIVSVQDARTATLDRSPTPTAVGIQGLGVVGGADTPDYKGGGWKVIILFGNSPLGASSSPTEITMVNPKQVGIPTMYGQQGLDGYGWQDVLMCSWQWLDPGLTFNPVLYTEPPCKRFKPNQFVEFTGRIEVRGAPNAPESRVQMWMDGDIFVDHPTARINWCPDSACPNGIGQFDLLLYHTRKDPTQVTPEAFGWYDDVIMSTQPIAMGGASPEPPDPPDPVPAPTITLNAAPSVITSGETSTLTWAALNATSVTLNGVTVGTSGSQPVKPEVTTTYVATATGAGGTATASATVTVNQPVPPQPGDIVGPSVSFKTADGATFSSNAKTIEFRASDNVGVVLCEPTVNGIKIQATPIFTEGAKLPATIKFYLQQATIPKGTYILGVSCKDAAGNVGTAQTISVTRK